jgi:hypothetical protein
MKKMLAIAIMTLMGGILFAYVNYDDVPAADWPFVNDDNVRVRTLPSLKYSEVIAKLNEGSRIRVAGESDETETVDGEAYRWFRVLLSDGRDGWIYGKYISFTDKLPEDEVIDQYAICSKAETLGADLYNELLYGVLRVRIGDQGAERAIRAYRSSNEAIDDCEESKVYDVVEGEALSHSDRFSVYAFKYGKIYLFDDYDEFRRISIQREMPNKYHVQVGMSIDAAKSILGQDIGERHCDAFDYYIAVDDEHELQFKTDRGIIVEIILSFVFGGE